MSYRVRWTRVARDDLKRLFEFLADRDEDAAQRARDQILKATTLLEDFPFTCRKIAADNSYWRELIIPFGASGYVMLFHIDDASTVTIAAVRHQHEDDYR